MKAWIGALIMTGVFGASHAAEDSSLNQEGTLRALSSSKTNETNPATSAEYGRLRKRELELTSRMEVLNELADEHNKKSEALKATQPEKAQWEMALVQDLRNRIVSVTKDLSAATQQTLVFEQTHGMLISTGPPSGALAPSIMPNPDEIAYLSLLQERLAKVQQDLAAVIEAGTSYTAELLTNSTPENMTRVSFLMQENGREVRELEREQADLQLRKLEFRTRRK